MEKLVLCSKILIDRDYLAIKKENELLRYHLFFMKNPLKDMQCAIRFCNNRMENSPQCRCKGCYYKFRIPCARSEEWDTDVRVCEFDKWMQNVCGEYNISVQLGVNKGERVNLEDVVFGKSTTSDCHICFLSGYENWDFFAYGTKVTQCQSIAEAHVFIKFYNFMSQALYVRSKI
jgi:hypothetical protein